MQINFLLISVGSSPKYPSRTIPGWATKNQPATAYEPSHVTRTQHDDLGLEFSSISDVLGIQKLILDFIRDGYRAMPLNSRVFYGEETAAYRQETS
jgi:hypothetical protein